MLWLPSVGTRSWCFVASFNNLPLETSIVAEAFNDILHVETADAEVLAEYAGGYYAGEPRFQHIAASGVV